MNTDALLEVMATCSIAEITPRQLDDLITALSKFVDAKAGKEILPIRVLIARLSRVRDSLLALGRIANL